jgi:type III restriction enzyme
MKQDTLINVDERPDELVLKHLRPENFDWNKYQNFLDNLCGSRTYQKEAIKAAVTFYLSKQYKNVQELAKENYEVNEHIKELHNSESDFLGTLEFPDKLCCTIDLATGTGKSWVMYGVAQILLAENEVDRALILVPTLTIEKQLKEKFVDFTSNSKLKKSLPSNSKYKNPRIISADRTLMPGDICIENDEAILEHLKISQAILEGLEGKGQRTLLLNDEAHHLISKEVGGEKLTTKWHDFVKNPKYNFKYIFNCTGTPYKGNNYFRDVIYRYSIRKAIDDGYIKDISYLTEDEGEDKQDKFSLILKNHEENKKKYKEIKKPLTIFVTSTVDLAKESAEEFKKYLIKIKKIDAGKADDLILVVSSRAEHKENVAKLDNVDSTECPVEFIFSVSMLSEGWDVKNVFQIVPDDKRAFDSKLLISQVLGRGLRIPLVYENRKDIQPIVTVTNHQKWSKDIEYLVDAVAEINRLASYSVRKKPDFNFITYWLSPRKEIREIRKEAEAGSISLPNKLGFKHQFAVREAKFHDVKDNKTERVDYDVELGFQSVGDVATQIMTRLQDYDKNNKTDFSNKITAEKIKELLQKELKKIDESADGKISDENRQRALQSFNVLFRKTVGTDIITIKFDVPEERDTLKIPKNYVSTRSLMSAGRAILFDKMSVELSEKYDENMIIAFDKDRKRPNGSVMKIEDNQIFKCPLNIVHINQGNEREFVERLIDKNNAENYDSWVKIPDQSFYTIEYSYNPASHSLTRKFSPDFFIKKGQDIIVVEIKSPGDTKPQNVAKDKAARVYFDDLNKKLNGKQTYHFTFLSKEDYSAFFKALSDKKFKMPKTGLQADLESKE